MMGKIADSLLPVRWRDGKVTRLPPKKVDVGTEVFINQTHFDAMCSPLQVILDVDFTEDEEVKITFRRPYDNLATKEYVIQKGDQMRLTHGFSIRIEQGELL